MSLKDFLFGKPQPDKEAPGRSSRPLTLAPAPTFRPLPAISGNPVDAKVSELWRIYQKQHPSATWAQFLRDLEAENIDRAKRIADVKTRLADYPASNRFVP